MDPAGATPNPVDLTVPNAARVYDYYLGGSHNFAVDRAMAEQAIRLWPEVPTIVRANRMFLHRAVRYLVDRGLRQFLDLGSGIPSAGNVHEIAQRGAPDARVVYVDTDPVAVAYGRQILDGNPGVRYLQGDLRRPATLLADPRLRDLLDLTRPVAVLMVAVLHFVPDDDDPGGIVAAYRDALPAGSHLAFSHATDDGQPGRAAEHQRLYEKTPTPMTMRSHRQIGTLLAGWDLAAPGLVRLPLWRPDPADESPEHPERFAGYAAVASKS